MKCANCDSKSHFIYSVTKGHAIYYCGKHIPAFLKDRKSANLIPTTDDHAQDNASAIAALAVTEKKEPSALEKAEERIEAIVEKTEEELKKVRKKAAPKKAE
jgi:hypothetical protein